MHLPTPFWCEPDASTILESTPRPALARVCMYVCNSLIYEKTDTIYSATPNLTHAWHQSVEVPTAEYHERATRVWSLDPFSEGVPMGGH